MLLRFLFCVVIGVALLPGAQAAQRVALVIGNGEYKDAPLSNPVNDASDMAATLAGLGFAVQRYTDLDQRQMHHAIRRFGDALTRAEVGVFYYAGHGMQVGGRNYLIPIGADIEAEDEVPYQAIDADQVLAKMESAHNPVNILILDACRDNPLERSFRSASRGLVRMESPVGSLVLYATAPGATAADGTGRNGVFTQHLMEQLRQPGLSLDDVVLNTRVAVMRDTADRQVPWSSSSLTRKVFLAGSAGEEHRGDGGYKLVIEPNPGDAQIRILNIGPKYQPGMVLPAGRYHIEATQRGYRTERRWVALSAAQQVFAFALEPTTPSSTILPQEEMPGQPSHSQAGNEWRDPVTGMEFVWVPEGCFEMGSNEGQSDEKPVHEVCVDGFWMGKYEVTQGEWERVMGDNPAWVKGDDHPVEHVSWDDAQSFINKLNNKGQGGFRLPTEAEWEYACRSGGRQEKYCGGNDVDRVAWYASNSGGETHPVGQKAANGLDLYDMSGNVWEWVSDRYDINYYRNSPKDNPQGPSAGAIRVLRGGSWFNSPAHVRAAFRGNDSPGDRGFNLGFRLLRTYP